MCFIYRLDYIRASHFWTAFLVCHLLWGIFECRPSLPRYRETWDVTVVLDYLAKLGPPEKLEELDFESGHVDGFAFRTASPDTAHIISQ